MKRYTPQHIANYFLDRAQKEGRTITPLKLVKLVYIAYGWVKGITGQSLFDEPIQAWRYGPVVPSIYHEFKHFVRGPITEHASALDLESGEYSEPRIESDDDTTNLILDHVWTAYRSFSGEALIRRTHEEGTPWQRTFKEGERGSVIPDDLIQAYFEERIGEYIAEAKLTTGAEPAPPTKARVAFA